MLVSCKCSLKFEVKYSVCTGICQGVGDPTTTQRLRIPYHPAQHTHQALLQSRESRMITVDGTRVDDVGWRRGRITVAVGQS